MQTFWSATYRPAPLETTPVASEPIPKPRR